MENDRLLKLIEHRSREVQLMMADEVDAELLQRQLANPLKYYVPNGFCERVIRAVGTYTPKKFIYIMPAANSVGKSTVVINILGNIIWGQQNPWFNFPIFKEWPFPKKFWYISENSTLKDTVCGTEERGVGLISDWFPKDQYTFIKSGMEYLSRFEATKRGWSGVFKTYDMDVTKFESARVGVIVLDEPPPQFIFDACLSKLTMGGIILMPMTPLQHSAWIKDRLVDGATEKSPVHIEAADDEVNCRVHGLRGRLDHDVIESLRQTYTEEQRAARTKGEWLHMSGLVYKNIHPAKHRHSRKPHEFRQDEFRIYNVVDPHTVKPPMIGWFAMDRFKEAWAIDEYPNEDFDSIKNFSLTTKDICRIIRDREKANGWDPAQIKRIMDPNYGLKRNEAFGKKTHELFAMFGRELDYPYLNYNTQVNDSLEDGHALVASYLALTPDGNSRFKIGECCENIWKHMNRYSRRPQSSKKEEIDGPTERVAELHKDGADLCFDDKTEILSENGWVLFKDLEPGVKVATLGTTQYLEFQIPLEYHSYWHTGEMISGKTTKIDFLVTPNHRMLVYPQGHRLHLRLAKDIKLQDMIPVSSRGLRDEEDFLVEIYPGKRVWASDWAEFIGWFVSEGSATGTRGGRIQMPGRGYSIYIAQSEVHPQNIQRISQLLNRMDLHWARRHSNFAVSSKKLWEVLFPLGNSHQKYIPRNVLNLPRKCLERLFQSMMLGDGSRNSYTTVSKQLANDFTEVVSRLGMAFHWSERTPKPSVIRSTGQRILNSSLQYTISFRKTRSTPVMRRDERGKRFNVCKRQAYDGMVYCLTVANGTLLVRRNLLPFYSGNCRYFLEGARPPDGQSLPARKPTWYEELYGIQPNEDTPADWRDPYSV